jgi:hypothetical protein
MEKRIVNTKIKDIANYWQNNSEFCESLLNFDWSDSLTNCWNCGNKSKSLERCHIVPHSLGGKDVPENYVILCKSCHREAPNIDDKTAMWDWIKSNYVPMSFYGTYRFRKALVMFKKKEGYSWFDKAIHIENIFEKLKNEYQNNISVHFGDPKPNEITLYYMLKKLVN